MKELKKYRIVLRFDVYTQNKKPDYELNKLAKSMSRLLKNVFKRLTNPSIEIMKYESNET